MRLFSIIQWHHFAYMMISVALLGYGAAGAFATLAQKPLTSRFSAVFAGAAALFGVMALLAFLSAQQVGFNALEILWDPHQPARLGLIYALLILPFFCPATAICLSFSRFHPQIPRLYAADILGAAAGGLGSIGLLLVTTPALALRWTAVLGLAAAGLATWRHGQRWVSATLALMALAILALPASWTPLQASPYKELAQTLQIRGTQVLAEVSSPLGVVTAVASPKVPFRQAPGLSLMASAEPPEQIALFTDGIQNLALSFAQKQAHAGFFQPLFAALRNDPATAFSDFAGQLRRFLLRDDVSARSDDDKTLVLAVQE